jgi:1,4-dihydroxy-2-naphthoyl-CoA hydrolase
MGDDHFIYEFQVRLHDTDAAGVMFFGHLFRHLHDAYESFMASIGFPLQRLLQPAGADAPLRLPIIHASADYLLPLRLGDSVRVALSVAEVRTRSFGLDYALADGQGRPCGRGRTVHVLAATGSDEGARLPDRLRIALQARMVCSR